MTERLNADRVRQIALDPEDRSSVEAVALAAEVLALRERNALLEPVVEAARLTSAAYNAMIEAVFSPHGGEITVGELRERFHATISDQTAALDALPTHTEGATDA